MTCVKTIVVPHDLNQAARFASHLIVMKDGRVVGQAGAGQVRAAR